VEGERDGRLALPRCVPRATRDATWQRSAERRNAPRPVRLLARPVPRYHAGVASVPSCGESRRRRSAAASRPMTRTPPRTYTGAWCPLQDRSHAQSPDSQIPKYRLNITLSSADLAYALNGRDGNAAAIFSPSASAASYLLHARPSVACRLARGASPGTGRRRRDGIGPSRALCPR
jgi:hypothetical protein